MAGVSRDLVEAVTGGDPVAVDELVVACLPRLHAYVRLRMGGDLRAREGSLDIAQSVCRELITGLAGDGFEYRGEAAFLHYVFEAALNKIRERHRALHRQMRDVRREQPREGVGDDVLPLLAPDSVSRVVEARDELERLEAAFTHLPEHYREVLTKTRILGLSTAEVATSMGRSEQSVRNLAGRALRMLAKVSRPRP